MIKHLKSDKEGEFTCNEVNYFSKLYKIRHSLIVLRSSQQDGVKKGK